MSEGALLFGIKLTGLPNSFMFFSPISSGISLQLVNLIILLTGQRKGSGILPSAIKVDMHLTVTFGKQLIYFLLIIKDSK